MALNTGSASSAASVKTFSGSLKTLDKQAGFARPVYIAIYIACYHNLTSDVDLKDSFDRLINEIDHNRKILTLNPAMNYLKTSSWYTPVF
jgi:hypothetical protein